jgi:hypothetical protein
MAAPTNGMAVASLVCACAGIIPFLFGIPAILGVIFGFVARGQIRRTNGVQGGGGLALAGIICAAAGAVLAILATVLYVHIGHACSGIDTNSSQYQTCIRDHI